MPRKNQTLRKTNCFLLLLMIVSGSPVFAHSLNNPWVKIENHQLWVLSKDNVTYAPYFIKAVGYQPTPIGRYPSDWGYAKTDPHNYAGINNNVYDDPAILNRDFALLQSMNANTIRIWSGDKTTVSCSCSNNGRDTFFMTDSSNTTNTPTSNNTLDLAAKYGLKVIAGFWVNPLTFDAENNIGSTDSNNNPITGQDIINNFVTFVNTYKGNRAILFWAIGNENNYEQINGQNLNPRQLSAWYKLVDQMAQAAHLAEDPTGGKNYHPVAVVNGEIAEIGNSADGATDTLMPDLDIWGANIYRGKSFGDLFTEYNIKSGKPLWISEFGMDAFTPYTSVINYPTDINNLQFQLGQLTATPPYFNISNYGFVNQATQSAWEEGLWDEIADNPKVTIGASVMEYSDEWWQPYEFQCGAYSTLCNSTHLVYASPLSAFPDQYQFQQWFGIMGISSNPDPNNPSQWGPDIMTPRSTYNTLKRLWAGTQKSPPTNQF